VEILDNPIDIYKEEVNYLLNYAVRLQRTTGFKINRTDKLQIDNAIWKAVSYDRRYQQDHPPVAEKSE
jgi:hypothetical protein